ncbi:hypothetical protein [Nitrosospira sp. Nsp11]|uniref:hypothetical protein n=1 Tax=Nitrosospira sp. Nsp11 TaxID=1855338 RepID=UPI001160D627|nr:hypothetical protein [Nitrosospira sp. Nsp11]
MNNFVPWFVTAVMCSLMAMVFYSYANWLPIRVFDVFLMAWMSWAAIVVVRGYFKIYAIFDRMDRRAKDGRV